MKYPQMLELMGQVVTVTHELASRHPVKNTLVEWYSQKRYIPRAGWVVGFSHRQNGNIDIDRDCGNTFKQRGQVPCVMVAYWPTMKPVPVPLDGFILGGVPESPDNGGWRNLSPIDLNHTKAGMRQEASRIKRDSKGRFTKETL